MHDCLYLCCHWWSSYEVGIVMTLITNLTPLTLLCMFQVRIWISNVICHSLEVLSEWRSEVINPLLRLIELLTWLAFIKSYTDDSESYYRFHYHLLTSGIARNNVHNYGFTININSFLLSRSNSYLLHFCIVYIQMHTPNLEYLNKDRKYKNKV